MGVYIEKKQHIISSNIYFENNDPSLIDNVVDIRDIPPIIHPSVHEMLLLTKNIEDNNETIWAVEGNFSGTFEDSNSGESISLTGSYRAVMATYQD